MEYAAAAAVGRVWSGICDSVFLMKAFELLVDIETLEEGGYLAQARNLQGCLAEGRTRAKALEYVLDVARIIIELCIEKGWPLPPELEGISSPPHIKAKVLSNV